MRCVCRRFNDSLCLRFTIELDDPVISGCPWLSGLPYWKPPTTNDQVSLGCSVSPKILCDYILVGSNGRGWGWIIPESRRLPELTLTYDLESSNPYSHYNNLVKIDRLLYEIKNKQKETQCHSSK